MVWFIIVVLAMSVLIGIFIPNKKKIESQDEVKSKTTDTIKHR